MAQYLFTKILHAPTKYWTEKNVALPYKEFRALLRALDKRDRTPKVIFMWDIVNKKGLEAALLLRSGGKTTHEVPLSVPMMVEMAMRDPEELYAYLHTCTQLLPQCPVKEREDR